MIISMRGKKTGTTKKLDAPASWTNPSHPATHAASTDQRRRLCAMARSVKCRAFFFNACQLRLLADHKSNTEGCFLRPSSRFFKSRCPAYQLAPSRETLTESLPFCYQQPFSAKILSARAVIIILKTAVGRIRVCGFRVVWQGARAWLLPLQRLYSHGLPPAGARRMAAPCNEEQRGQATRKSCNRVRSVLTLQVKAHVATKLDIQAAFPALVSGQLRFLG